ncbi:GDSL lipase-like isoform X1 [Punica granatum]|uniref:GDSL lipase-like isoform X1 n=2 Tax=Punica granatum TaxID=22663 RepID=A0A6P8DQE6_PUNGR|nr:GDSL lipase-like isoform X1 [Punica granatum]
MATTIFHCSVLLFSLFFLGTATGCFGDLLQADDQHRPLRSIRNSFSEDGFESYSNQRNNIGGGRKFLSNGGWLGNSIFSYYCRFLLDMIRMPFNKKEVEADELKLLDHQKTLLFIFGDSLFDAGNNKYVRTTTYLQYPYGFTYFTHATGRICDGRIVPDMIAELANLPFIPPSMQPGANFSYGANFACVGATVLDSYATGNSSKETVTLREQMSQFIELAKKLNATLGPSRAKAILSKSVYVFSMGGDDYLQYYDEFTDEGRSPTLSEQQQQVNAVIGNLTEALMELYEEGARKIAFQNVGPMGCLPFLASNGSCVQALLTMPILHNKQLYEALTSLAERLEGFKFSVFDYFPSLLDRMQHPSDYGFEVGSTPCYYSSSNGYRGMGLDATGDTTLCKYPSAFLLFDDGHTTQCANEQLTSLFWNGDASVTRPYNLKQLFRRELIK